MSLAKTNLRTLVFMQFRYKLQTHRNLFIGLLLSQLLAVFFSFWGSGMASTASSNIVLKFRAYNGIIIHVFTYIWSLAVVIIITGPQFRDMDFAFVSNRKSSNLSNICFLLAAALAAAVTSTLCIAAQRVLIYFVHGSENILAENFFLSPSKLLVLIVAMFFYIVLLMSLAYLACVLARLHKIFVVIVPAVAILLLFGSTSQAHPLNISYMVHFFTREYSLPIFVLKVIAAAGLAFCLSIVVTDRMEVRK